MKHLAALNKYFWRYKRRFFLGMIFIILANYFRILSPQLTGFVIDHVTLELIQKNDPSKYQTVLEAAQQKHQHYEWLVQWFIAYSKQHFTSFQTTVVFSSVLILLVAILGGAFTYLMRQTIIVMSRHIEYAQKNEIYTHYQKLSATFYKANATGDLMTRISEDVSRVRMYTGPALMYFINLVALIGFCVFSMLRQDVWLTVYVLSPLPILAAVIYIANTIINKKSETVQQTLSSITSNAQESYAGIRVIKSFVQENNMLRHFQQNAETYRANAVGLARVDSIYFPSITLLIGLSTLLTVYFGSVMAVDNPSKYSVIVEFVMYVNMLTFPVSAIGWTASMIQRAAASQKRINEFLQVADTMPDGTVQNIALRGGITFRNCSYTYPNTGIQAIQHLSLQIQPGEKILIMGKTGSGKTTLAQLLLRFFDVNNGELLIDENPVQNFHLQWYRQQLSYVPQDVFLFSDTVANNILFGCQDQQITKEEIIAVAKKANIHHEIEQLPDGYETMVGERGVTLSGGQKQRICIARALLKKPAVLLLDDCLSAVDAKTEHIITQNFTSTLAQTTTIIIAHRVFTQFHFDRIIVLEDGKIVEEGTHQQLIDNQGAYAETYLKQTQSHTR
ncbi:MAG: ABC transporter ATP-binding protein [Bacteroidetes bacterium]|nr:MAG: ABC transporter ATP-binding protein [Bacteroidota bacterium]